MRRPTARVLLACATVAHVAVAYDGLRWKYFNTTAFTRGDLTYELITLTPDINFAPQRAPSWAQPYTSSRFEGTITSPTTDAVSFTVAVTPGDAVKLWLDDHLHLDSLTQDAGAAVFTTFFPAPLTRGQPTPIRLEYAHLSAAPPTLTLSWQAPSLPLGVVPSSALAPDVRAADDARWALRARMVEAPVAWNTAYAGSATAHVHVQSGLALALTLGDSSSGGALLGDVWVFQRSSPALVTLGGHSWNGSDYTQVNISRWGGRDCTVCIETAVVAGGADWLALVTASNGSDCGRIYASLQPQMVWERAGWFNVTGGGGSGGGDGSGSGSGNGSAAAAILATRPGFFDVTVHATGAGGAVPPATPLAGAPPSYALPLAPPGSGVGFSTGRAYALDEIQAAVAAARAAYAASRPAFNASPVGSAADLADAHDGVSSVLAWNLIYTPVDGHFTPVSRGWRWGGEQSLIFDWDVYFASWMASGIAARAGGLARDAAFANVIAVTLSWTWDGFVPNWRNGLNRADGTASFSPDRSEPQIGAATLARLVSTWGDDAQFLVELLWRPLLAWHNWTYTRRRAAGSLAPAGGGPSDLFCLGSDAPTSPPGDPTTAGQLAGARLESGQDNSPEFAFVSEGGAVTFNASSGHMELYSVLVSGLFASDTDALLALAPRARAPSATVAMLQGRLAATARAVNAHLWDGDAGAYTNVLFNGSFYRRYSPASFYPLIAGIPDDARVAATVEQLLTAREHFCVRDDARGPPGSTLGAHYAGGGGGANSSLFCGTPECVTGALANGSYTFIRLEALPWAAVDAAAAPVALTQWRHAASGTFAVAAGMDAPPGPGYAFVRVEGGCAPTDANGTLVPLDLWLAPTNASSSALPAQQLLCGAPACARAAAAAGYARNRTLCFAPSATADGGRLPCRYGVPPSISRSDAAFGEGSGAYWGGRVWAPHAALVYWGLQRYAHVPAAAAARATLAREALALFLRDWRALRRVNENSNALTGSGSDIDSADPFYHWGALTGFIGLLEADSVSTNTTEAGAASSGTAVAEAPPTTQPPVAVAIACDLGAAASTIPNAFSTITVWDPQSLASPPPPGLSAAYPFLTHVELFTATGGCYLGFAGCSSDRDLLSDPARGMAGGVNATRLFAPLRNVLAAGLKPHVVTGNVPVALSGADARIGGFGFNSAPPANLSEYASYVEQVAAQLVSEFGLAEVATWRWGVYTEYNNQDWLNGSAATYAALYDYTACGLERALGGAANVDIGVHACQQCGGPTDWDPLLFLEHAARGVSACTGGPVHLNSTGNSFYEHAPGAPGDLSGWAQGGRSILDAARSLGLPARRFGVDEGRLLWGPEGPSFALTTRAVGDSYQGSFDALFFKLLAETRAPEAYYARWGVNSGGGLFAAGAGAVDNAATNVAQLAFRMHGSAYVPTTNSTAAAAPEAVGAAAASGAAAPSLSIVDAVVGASSADGVLRALVLHHHPQLNVSGAPAAVASVALCGLSAAVPTGPVSGATATRVDDAHAQFWPAWRADAAAANISRAGGDYQEGWSEYSDNMPLASVRATTLLAANTGRYRLASALVPEPLGAGGGANTGAVVGADRCVRFAIELPPHGVALVELPALVR